MTDDPLMSDPVHDPVSGTRYAFTPDGDDLIVHCWLEPGGSLPPHLHPRQTEHWSVVEGEVRFQLGRDKRVIGPEAGEIAVAPGTVHGLASTGRVARLRCRVEPALHLREFLEESAAAAREGLFTRRGMPRGLAGTRWAARFLKRYRDETVFLSPPRPVQRLVIALFARD
jgi:mannose-6-phosphate isomerase-like protein (cupin superfamily)